MPYQRCDVDCNVVSPQPQHGDVTQAESCLVYENYNLDYVRTDVDCVETTPQPDIKSGYNGDYIRVLVDGTKITGISQQLVAQTLYQPTNVDNVDIPFVCYNAPPPIGTVVDLTEYIKASEWGEPIYIANEQGADYVFEFQGNDRTAIEVEDNTLINPEVLISN